ncbi:7935_t:CDS:2, partial [Funneliformis geosporum]
NLTKICLCTLQQSEWLHASPRVDWLYLKSSKVNDWIANVLCEWKRKLSIHLKRHSLIFAEKLSLSDRRSMLNFYNLTVFQNSPRVASELAWFGSLQKLLTIDVDFNELRHKTPHTNPYVIGWNLGDNKPFLGKLLRTSLNLANIMHINPTIGRNQRIVLSPRTRCIYHNPITKIPPQTKDSEHRCFSLSLETSVSLFLPLAII